MITGEALLRLCDEHFQRTRRIATCIAVPLGVKAALKKETERHGPFPGRHVVGLFLYTHQGEAASIEELPIAEPEVLSDRDP